MIDDLKREYAALDKSEEKPQAFIDHLMAASGPAVIAWHYELLDEDIHLVDTFINRGIIAGDFLLQQMDMEERTHMQRKIIDMLGYMKHPAIRDIVLRNVQSPEQETRRQACYVLSWVGRAEDLVILQKLLQEEPVYDVRVEAAMSLIEWGDRLPEQSMNLLIQTLRDIEGDSWEEQELIAWLVISAQQLTGLYFGLDEVADTIGFSGEVFDARKKLLKRLT